METINFFSRATKPIFLLVAAFLVAFSARVDAQTIDIGPNQYAFQFTQNPNFGLFFNSTNLQYEFRNGTAAPIFSFNANNGDLTSDLRFASGSDYLVPNNTYAFRSAANPNYGLFFNSSNLRYEFRGSTGNSLFDVSAANGNLETSGTISASGGSSTQWNQAHAWGDHAAAGYINAESDPKIANDLENLDVPYWNGSQLVSSAITAGTSFARVTGSPFSISIPGTPEGSVGNLLRLENPGASPFGGFTSESRLAFSKEDVVIGQIATDENDMRFAATNNGNMILRTGGSDRMTMLPNGDVGLGITDPSHRLHVSGTVRATTNSYAVRGTKTGDGTFPGVWGETESTSANASGVRGYVNSTSPGGNSAGVYGHNFSTTGLGIGVRGIHDGTGWGVYGESSGGRGVFGNSISTQSSTAYGVFGNASGSGGTRIGVYGSAFGGTKSWAGYFAGATYVSGDLRVGTLDGAAGYKVSVNGNMICNELRVQLTGNWPDYVFDDSYDRLSLDELGDFIKTEKHLPNVPSAAELEEQGGVDLGEMQRLTMEKVEELTLYILELKKNSDTLSEENAELRNRIEELEK